MSKKRLLRDVIQLAWFVLGCHLVLNVFGNIRFQFITLILVLWAGNNLIYYIFGKIDGGH